MLVVSFKQKLLHAVSPHNVARNPHHLEHRWSKPASAVDTKLIRVCMSPNLEERSPKSTAQSEFSIDLHLSTSQRTGEQSHDKIDGTVTRDLVL